MKITKKGQSADSHLINWIILLVSIIILLLFLSKIDFSKTIEQQFCRLTVIGNGAFPSLLREGIPLSCKTNNICISRDGTCENAKESKIVKAKSLDQIYDILSEEMIDCWWMFNQGKTDYIKKDIKDLRLFCSICSKVSFDNSLYSIEGLAQGKVSRITFFKYLENKKFSKEQSYSDYMKIQKSSEMENILKNIIDKNKDNTQLQGKNVEELFIPKINIFKDYFILTGVYNRFDSDLAQIVGTGIGAALGMGATYLILTTVGVSTGGLGFLLYLPLAGVGAYAGVNFFNMQGKSLESSQISNSQIIGKTIQGEAGKRFLTPTIIEANSQELAALECKTITTSS